MTKVFTASVAANGLTVKAYAGDRCAMLAFNLDDHLTAHLAGFAIRRRMAPSGDWRWLGNRVAFASQYGTLGSDKFYPSNVAPFQKFWWLDFPADGAWGTYEYEISAMRFTQADGSVLKADQVVTLRIDVGPFVEDKLTIAFTRGYLSSQAYADRFHNSAYQPGGSGDWNFDSAPYQTQWQWLGGHARQTIIDFFIECRDDPNASIDALVYDFNEPDIVNALATFKGRLRMLADDSKLHADDTAHGKACAYVAQQVGEDNVKRGHFSRYQHNKVLIKRVKDKNGTMKPVKVLTGSTNFSVTGIYVNANHVLVFDDPAVAQSYQDAFDVMFEDGAKSTDFEKHPAVQGERDITSAGLPKLKISYAPHKKPTHSLDTLLGEIKAADSSVIFAVMDLTGGGDVLKTLSELHADQKVFSYGISDKVNPADNTYENTQYFDPTKKSGEVVYSKENPEKLPAPFSQEKLVTGIGHIVHHKFVVVDFNDTEPVVFCGSSNLAEGGEEANGDNLIAIYDRAVATAFAIEGIRLVDHYAYAAALKNHQDSGDSGPLALQADSKQWWSRYYVDGSIKQKERLLFSR